MPAALIQASGQSGAEACLLILLDPDEKLNEKPIFWVIFLIMPSGWLERDSQIHRPNQNLNWFEGLPTARHYSGTYCQKRVIAAYRRTRKPIVKPGRLGRVAIHWRTPKFAWHQELIHRTHHLPEWPKHIKLTATPLDQTLTMDGR